MQEIHVEMSYTPLIQYIPGIAAEIILCMRPANGRRRYTVTSSPIGWAHRRKWSLNPAHFSGLVVFYCGRMLHFVHTKSHEASRPRDLVLNCGIALKFDWRLGCCLLIDFCASISHSIYYPSGSAATLKNTGKDSVNPARSDNISKQYIKTKHRTLVCAYFVWQTVSVCYYLHCSMSIMKPWHACMYK